VNAAISFDIAPQGDTAAEIRWRQNDHVALIAANLATVRLVEQAELRGLVAAVHGFETLTVHYDPLVWASWLDFSQALRTLLQESTLTPSVSSRTIEIPVCYAAAFGPDLELVAMHAGLSVAEVVQRHSRAEYRVQMLGFMPGFPYLDGLPAELAMPRKEKPRLEVAAGSVAIGGVQTGIYPVASPAGWQVVGRTPLCLFDPALNVPALLSAGDRVRLRAISVEEFRQLEGHSQ
jgi:KipI family sensor histidine kinase inhibitor